MQVFCKVDKVYLVEKTISVGMKKTYSKLKTDRVVVSTESGIMSCSARVNTSVTVEEYHDYTFTGDHVKDGGKAWEIGFTEPTFND